MSIDKRMDKEDEVYTHTHTHTYIKKMKHFSGTKKKEILPFEIT